MGGLHRDSAIRRQDSRLTLSYNRWVEVFLSLPVRLGLSRASLPSAVLCRVATIGRPSPSTHTCALHFSLSDFFNFISFITHLLYHAPWYIFLPCDFCAPGCCFCPSSVSTDIHPFMSPPFLCTQMLFLFPFVLLWSPSESKRKRPFSKISMQTWFPQTLRHHASFGRHWGLRDVCVCAWGGERSINLIKRFRKWRA